MVYRKGKTLFVFPILETANQVSTCVTLEKSSRFFIAISGIIGIHRNSLW